MARLVRWGTPGRSQHYPPLRAEWRFLRLALVLGGAALVGLLLLWAVGFRGALAPGSVISPHASFEARCEECHTARAGVADVRCQRCHDPSGAGRLTNAAHVFFGSSDPKKAAALRQMVEYCLTEGQKASAAMGYIPLPETVVAAVRKASASIQ
jgi:hypothetical protein